MNADLFSIRRTPPCPIWFLEKDRDRDFVPVCITEQYSKGKTTTVYAVL